MATKKDTTKKDKQTVGIKEEVKEEKTLLDEEPLKQEVSTEPYFDEDEQAENDSFIKASIKNENKEDEQDYSSINDLLQNPIGESRADEYKQQQPSQGFEEEERDSRTVVMETTIKELFSLDGLHMKTRIKEQQVIPLAKGVIFAELYGSKSMANLVSIIQQLNISLDGKGRTEMTSIIQQSSNGMIEDESRGSNFFERIFNK